MVRLFSIKVAAFGASSFNGVGSSRCTNHLGSWILVDASVHGWPAPYLLLMSPPKHAQLEWKVQTMRGLWDAPEIRIQCHMGSKMFQVQPVSSVSLFTLQQQQDKTMGLLVHLNMKGSGGLSKGLSSTSSTSEVPNMFKKRTPF